MTTTYDASTIKRARRTKAEIAGFRQSIHAIVEANRPCSARQVYYLGIGVLWDKDTGGKRRNYNQVVHNLGVMRETGMLPWGWITDGTRYRRIPTMFDSLEDALERWQESYRRDLWSTQPRRVEVWAESDSVSGIIDSVTRTLGVGLFSCRGQASKTFAQDSAAEYAEVGKPVTICYVGDWDPSGLAITRSLEERLVRYSKGAVPIELERVALTVEDVRSGGLTTHEVNTADQNHKRYAETCRELGLDPNVSTEVEALAPATLRDRLEGRLYELVDNAEAWNATIDYERAEREQLRGFTTGGLSPVE